MNLSLVQTPSNQVLKKRSVESFVYLEEALECPATNKQYPTLAQYGVGHIAYQYK